jgi:hypothetical protein
MFLTDTYFFKNIIALILGTEYFSQFKPAISKIILPCHINVFYIQHTKSKGTVHPRTGCEGPKGEEKYSCTLSLTSLLDGVCGQCHVPASLPPGKRLGTDCTGGRVGPRGCLDGCGSPTSTGIQSLNCPDHSESLYQVHCPSPNHMNSHDDITRFVPRGSLYFIVTRSGTGHSRSTLCLLKNVQKYCH